MIKGVGIDIVDVPRFKAAMERRGEAFCKRLFTDSEIDYCMRQRTPERHLAARFAAKISVFKALGRSFSYKEIEVARDGSGKPEIRFLNGSLGNMKLSTTLSHDGRLSIANTIIEI